MTAEEQVNEEEKQETPNKERWSVVGYFDLSDAQGHEVANILEATRHQSSTLRDFMYRAQKEISKFEMEQERNLAYFMMGREVESIEQVAREE